jgi:hypothetical protein
MYGTLVAAALKGKSSVWRIGATIPDVHCAALAVTRDRKDITAAS